MTYDADDDDLKISRRALLAGGGATILGAVAGGLILPADAKPTEASGSLGQYAMYTGSSAKSEPVAAATPDEISLIPSAVAPKNFNPTQDNILGPFHRKGAPFRGKVTPPLEPGKVVLVKGRVWSFKTKKPLAGVTMDIWQASAKGRYDNDDPANQPKPNYFANRTRLVTDETGYYEFETIHPGQYQIGPNTWRPSHIHYWVRHPQHKELVTQLYFEGDQHNKTDQFIKTSLIVKFAEKKINGQAIEIGRFDIVLA